MKILLTIVLTFFAFSVCAQQVSLVWEASPTEGVEGYVLYYGQDSTNMEYSRDLGNVLATTVEGLGSGTWFFAVTAYSQTRESEYSNVVSYMVDEFTPIENIHVPVTRPARVNITIEVD